MGKLKSYQEQLQDIVEKGINAAEEQQKKLASKPFEYAEKLESEAREYSVKTWSPSWKEKQRKARMPSPIPPTRFLQRPRTPSSPSRARSPWPVRRLLARAPRQRRSKPLLRLPPPPDGRPGCADRCTSSCG